MAEREEETDPLPGHQRSPSNIRSGADVPPVDVVEGCLLGGAIGDALGAAIEFDRMPTIRAQHGAAGLTDYAEAYGRIGAITDDTQMTLFTLEGMIRASVRRRSKGIVHVPSMVHRAYLRWLSTQEHRRTKRGSTEPAGWLVEQPELRHTRAPGNTCLGALRSGGMGSVEQPVNDSKGCGGVMRVAPAGLLWRPEKAFEMGCAFAAITHGHPTGWLTGGVLAATVSGVVDGSTLVEAVSAARRLLQAHPKHAETSHHLDWAMAAGGDGLPTPEEIDALNTKGSAGWVAEEALGIALRCSLAAERLAGGHLRDAAAVVPDALLAAVNHSGDSDSAGAIAGNVLGAAVGAGGLPARWVVPLEVRGLIATMARDFVIELGPEPPTNSSGWEMASDIPTWWWDRYPGA